MKTTVQQTKKQLHTTSTSKLTVLSVHEKSNSCSTESASLTQWIASNAGVSDIGQGSSELTPTDSLETRARTEKADPALICHPPAEPQLLESREIQSLKVRTWSMLTALNGDHAGGVHDQNTSPHPKRQRKESTDTVPPSPNSSKLDRVGQLSFLDVSSDTDSDHECVVSETTYTSLSASKGFLDSPSRVDIDEFLLQAEQHELKSLTSRYNFDFENEASLPGRYEWIKVTGST